MSDSLDPNVSPASPSPKKRRAAPNRSQRRAESQRLVVPDWVPWAVIGGLIVAGAVGSRVVQAAVKASDAAKSSEKASAEPAAAAPTALSQPSARVLGAPSAQAANAAEQKISVLHLVVTHAESVMGQSLHVTRTREQAKQRAGEALARARKGEDFAKLVSEYTEEPHTDQTHGELKNFTRKEAIPSFSEAAFTLKVGELSGVVDTPFGYMVILRTK